MNLKLNSNFVRVLLIVGGIAVLYFLVTRYFNSQKVESFASEMNHSEGEMENQETDYSTDIQASQGVGQNEVYGGIEDGEQHETNNNIPVDCYPRDQLKPDELLPGDANSQWAKINPAGQGALGDQNFLNAGFHIGVNTVGQSLRNANLQLRSEPPNPQLKVSPWMQSTIEPDTNRRALEINGCD